MSSQTVTLNIPDPLYQRLRDRAEQAERGVEDEVLEVLASAIAADGRLPADLESLRSLDDAALWNAARSRLAAEVSEEIESLHLKQQREGLAEDEERRLAGLMGQYERHLLIRAQALALLKQRGHAVDDLLSAPRKPSGKEAMLRMAGAFKDDPFLDDIVRQAYEERARSREDF